MKEQPTRILLTLAASRFDESDLYQFFKEVEKRGAVRTTDVIVNLRQSVGQSERSLEVEKPVQRKQKSQFREGKITKDIESMLVGSAGLQKREAMQILLAELHRRHGDDWNWPSTNKVAFDLWLSRLADQIEPSELLHIATQVRNDIVHGRRSVSDWPLNNG